MCVWCVEWERFPYRRGCFVYQLSFPDWLCNEPARVYVSPDQSLAQPFTFYATFDSDSECSYIPAGTSVLLPASSYARDNLRKPRLPGTIHDVAADCGGYVASRIWGEYRYSLEQYVNWLRSFSPRWAATWTIAVSQTCIRSQPLGRRRQPQTPIRLSSTSSKSPLPGCRLFRVGNLRTTNDTLLLSSH